MPTSQKAEMDLVAMGDTVEAEKERLLNSVRCTEVVLCEAATLPHVGGKWVAG